jgi:polyadenylate-binding protein
MPRVQVSTFTARTSMVSYSTPLTTWSPADILDEWDDDRLRSEFEPFGSITSCRVMKDEKGVSRNFGFVCYASPDEATKAVSEMNGKMIGTKPLYVALAQRKDVRRQALESQMANRSTQQYNVPPPYMGAPMYGYNGQPMMPMRPMYPGQQQMMMGGRGGPGGPGGRGMMPPQMGAYGMQMGGYPGMPQQMGGYPGMPPQQYGARPMRPPAPSGGPQINGRSPTGAPQGLPVARGQMPQRPQQGFQDQQQGQAQPGRLNAASLARAGQAEQKQMLGEVLYPLIHEGQPDLAGKITGMLLEMDNGELLHLVESPAALQEKVDEALRVLAEWGSKGENGEEVKEEVKEEKAE